MSEERTLRLVPGGAGDEQPPRSVRRRAATRRTPRRDPIATVLAHLDEEPATDPVTDRIESQAEAPEAIAEPKEEAPAPRRTAEARRKAQRRPRVAGRREAARPRLRLRPVPVTTVALAVLVCAALAVAAVTGTRWYGDRALERAHQQALAAAKQLTVDFVSVSAGSVDRDLQRIVAGATGDFRDEFTRGQAQVRAAVVENNVDSRGTVLRAALVSGDRDSAVVLVAVDATVRNAKAPDGRASHYRIQVEVAHDRGSGRWLVSKLQFVG